MGTVAIATPKIGGEIRSMSGQLRAIAATYLFSTSYPTGGESVDINAVFPGLAQRVRWLVAMPQAGYYFDWNPATRKLLAYQDSAGGVQQVAAATDLRAAVGTVILFAVAVGEKEDDEL